MKKNNRITSFLSFFRNTNKHPLFLGIAVSLILTIIIFRNFLFTTKGIVILGDLVWAYKIDLNPKYTWHPYTQNSIDTGLIIWSSILNWFTSELAQRIFLSLIFITMGTTMFHVTFATLKKMGLPTTLGALIATIIYMISPIIIPRISHIHHLTGYALLPLLFHFCFSFFGNYEINFRHVLKYSFSIGIVWTVMSLVSPFWIVVTFPLIIFFIIINIRKPILHFIFKSIKFLALSILFYFLFSLWKFLPFLYETFATGIPSPSYVFTYEVLKMLSRHSTMLHVLMRQANWWPIEWPGEIYALPLDLHPIWVLANFVVPLVAFTILFTKYRKNRKIISLTILTIIILLLATGVSYPLIKDIYTYLVLEAPIISTIGWIFRDPDKFMILLGLPYSLFSGIIIANLWLKSKSMKMTSYVRHLPKMAFMFFIVIFLAFNSIAAFPLLTGNLRGNMIPQELPSNYKDMNHWLDEQTGDFKVIMYPYPPEWLIPKSLIRSDKYWSWASSSFLQNKTNRLGKVMSCWDAKYFIIRADLLTTEQQQVILTLINGQKDFTLVEQFGDLYVFENLNFAPQFRVQSSSIGIYGSLDIVNSLTIVDNFSPFNNSLFLLDSNLNLFTECVNIMIFDEKTSLFVDEESILICPFDAVTHHNPYSVWSKAATNDPLHGPWHPYLDQKGITNWDFDYGKGLVLTQAPSILKEPSTLKEEDLLLHFDFEDMNLKGWYGNTPPFQQLLFSEDAYSDKFSIVAELYNSTWGWKTINSPLLPTEYGTFYKWLFYVKGENAQSVHVKMVEYDVNKNILLPHQTVGVGTGNFSWTEIAFNFAITSPQTNFIQLQIWHGHETQQSLPNRVWVDDVKVYDLRNYVQPNTLTMEFNVQSEGNYYLFTRCFQNEDGGRIGINLDQSQILIDTKDQLNKFTWKELGNYHLNNGAHNIAIENIEGFNAINLLVLIPQNAIDKMKVSLTELLENTKIVYVLEAESDMYHQNVKTMRKYGGEASNGEALELTPSSSVWKELEIVKSGNYMLSVRGKGILNIRIDGKEYTTHSTRLEWTYLGPITLEEKRYKIEISTSQLSDLDVIWLYYTEKMNETLEDIFTTTEKTAEIIRYQKIDPTKYVVSVNATQPFMLSFTEAYDPLWVAYVNDEKTESIPLYSVVNGFWINKTGQLEIVIEYTPQKWFTYGAIISFTTLLFLVIYLVYSHLKWKYILKQTSKYTIIKI